MSHVRKRALQPGERIRVLVVDDSVVIRRLVTHALEEGPAIEVVGSAPNGSLALQRIPQLNPDLITLDIEMPEMDGLEVLRRVRQSYPAVRVIMFSTLTERGAAVTIEALSLGADDYVTKASNEGSLDRSLARLREELLPKIKQFFELPDGRPRTPPRPIAPTTVSGAASCASAGGSIATAAKPRVLAVGVSTGGPTALAALLPALPQSFPLPVLVVQHMPPLFTRLLAERLNASCKLRVSEAVQGEPIEPGRILIAPGDYHMRAASAGTSVRVCLDQSQPLNSCRPAVDALFASVGEVYGGSAIAAVLTGMGQDGLRGAQILKAHGAAVLVQDEATSVVWGMPGAVAQAGAADAVLPLDRIVPEVLRIAGPR